MKVLMAKKAGFCMGVRRAVQLALKAAGEAPRPVYTYGPLIHNAQALMLLEALGVRPLKEIPSQGQGTIIVRAHGVPPEEKERLRQVGFQVIDGTCPRVLRVQALARRYSKQGYHVIIIGDADHAEVKGILGYAGDKGLVVSNLKDLENLPPLQKYVILSQTTQDGEFFAFITQEILKRFPGGKVYDTICNATHERQREVRRLCETCDAIVVVGGKNSANTKRLAMIAQEEGREVFLVETAEELPLERLRRFKKVGVTAGASTPNWVINQVVRTLEELPSPYEPSWQRLIRKLLRFSFESNLALALGAASLCITALLLLGLTLRWVYPLLAGTFIFSAHTLNRVMDIQALRLNDPFRARFLERHRGLLLGLSFLGYLSAAALAWQYARPAFWLVAFLLVVTALYSLPLFWRGPGFKVRWLPGARSILIALAWMTVSTLVPWLSEGAKPSPYLVMGFIFLVAFIRAVFLEVLEVQGDGFVGKETLPVFIGEEKTFQVLRGALALLALNTLALGVFQGLNPIHVVALLLVPAYAFFTLRLYEYRLLGQSLLLETLSEGLPLVCLGATLLGRVLARLS